MHSVTIVFGPASLQFLFKTKEPVEQFRSFRSDHPTQDLIIDDDSVSTPKSERHQSMAS